ncbi:MAG: alpha/beta hydrolase [Pirellulales bacterium]|nr:alpha/beta hydrolase [Pirellulales bacterium]
MDSSKNFKFPAGPKLHYLESGSGSPLLLLPGWSQAAAMFHHQLDAFGGSHRVPAFDDRGHGESKRIGHENGVSTLALDLRH